MSRLTEMNPLEEKFLHWHAGEVDLAILMQLACLFSIGLWPITMSLPGKRSVLLLLFLG